MTDFSSGDGTSTSDRERKTSKLETEKVRETCRRVVCITSSEEDFKNPILL